MDACCGLLVGHRRACAYSAPLAAFPTSMSEPSATEPGPAYRAMQSRGELELIGERVVPVADLLRRAVERWGRPGCRLLRQIQEPWRPPMAMACGDADDAAHP